MHEGEVGDLQEAGGRAVFLLPVHLLHGGSRASKQVSHLPTLHHISSREGVFSEVLVAVFSVVS